MFLNLVALEVLNPLMSWTGLGVPVSVSVGMLRSHTDGNEGEAEVTSLVLRFRSCLLAIEVWLAFERY